MLKKRNLIYIVLFCLLLFSGYYFYPRNVSYKLVQKVKVENNVDKATTVICSKESLYKFLNENLKKTSDLPLKYSLLDFSKYDYLVIFNQEITELKYSPYLSKKNDLCSYLKKKPIIPSYGDATSKCLYIYKLKKRTDIELYVHKKSPDRGFFYAFPF